MRLFAAGLIIAVIGYLVWIGLGGLLEALNVWDPSKTDFKDYLLAGVFIIFPLGLGIPIVVLLLRPKPGGSKREPDSD